MNVSGGVELLIHTKSIFINDDNLLESINYDLERLCISVKCGTSNVAIGVVYFPVENKLKRHNAHKNYSKSQYKHYLTQKHP